MKLLDTDTCIEILRGNQTVIDRRATVEDEVATTWITAAELYYGAAKSARPERHRELVTSFLQTLPLVDMDSASSRTLGDVKATLERAGQKLADADLLIASIALAQGAAVITGNRRHYERVPGIVVEDWIRA